MARYYSRYTSLEEKRNIRRAFVYGILTIIALILFLNFGLPTLAKFVGFLSDFARPVRQVGKNDNIPPPPPRFTNLPEYTNQKTIDAAGTAEPGATVKLSLNDRAEEVLADSDGKFSIKFNLNKGENSLSAKAVDSGGNESQRTKVYKIIFDDVPPEITIDSPSDGSSFYGEKQRQLSVKGKTEIGSSLTINDRLVAVNDDGSFVFTTTLSEGENAFSVKATDKAGNSTEKTFKVNFTP
ncbi:hypothetical protein HY008_01130 [Candidatus Woesebacteria bacterium]|nr:hypothetical protein [Candidatus Woesebacteria bacterium]